MKSRTTRSKTPPLDVTRASGAVRKMVDFFAVAQGHVRANRIFNTALGVNSIWRLGKGTEEKHERLKAFIVACLADCDLMRAIQLFSLKVAELSAYEVYVEAFNLSCFQELFKTGNRQSLCDKSERDVMKEHIEKLKIEIKKDRENYKMQMLKILDESVLQHDAYFERWGKKMAEYRKKGNPKRAEFVRYLDFLGLAFDDPTIYIHKNGIAVNVYGAEPIDDFTKTTQDYEQPHGDDEFVERYSVNITWHDFNALARWRMDEAKRENILNK